MHTQPLAAIDRARLEQMGMVTLEGGRTTIAEEFRIIKRPLLRAAFQHEPLAGRHANLIGVTSALSGEGKTFCAINLAMSVAMEKDHTVLLVDADVGSAALMKVLGLPAGPGLMDILLGPDAHLADTILRTNVDGLSILPAGRSHRNATELLASQAMSCLLDEIASRYPDRIVIFDTPPLLVTTEASVLAAKMGQIVMVVAAQSTTQSAVREALRRLEPCTHVKLLCNKSDAFPATTAYHGYGD